LISSGEHAKKRKARLVLDSSTLVSAFLSEKGGSALLLKQIKNGKFDAYITGQTLNEFKHALSKKKFGFSQKDVNQSAKLVRDICKLEHPRPEFNATKCEDEDDNKFLALCDQVNADFLITFDPHLLVIKKYMKTRILTAGVFLKQRS